MGPVQLVAGRGMDVRPHPHIGLATVTYLFDGRVTHEDSEGNDMDITPGAMNLMTAGRGISHSERTPASMRATGGSMFGIQSWIALPQDHEEMAPLFEHFDASSLPAVVDGGVRARVIAGSSFGQKSPVGMVSEWFYAEVMVDAGASAALEGPRYLWWNFVSSRKERIDQAKEEWKTGKFAPIPGDEKEFIPLPEN